jgi:hypothetical protein
VLESFAGDARAVSTSGVLETPRENLAKARDRENRNSRKRLTVSAPIETNVDPKGRNGSVVRVGVFGSSCFIDGQEGAGGDPGALLEGCEEGQRGSGLALKGVSKGGTCSCLTRALN